MTISLSVFNPSEIKRWVSRIKARNQPVEVQKVVVKSDLALKEVRAKAERSRLRLWAVCCIYAAICIDVSGYLIETYRVQG
jgi:hypothetical protein